MTDFPLFWLVIVTMLIVIGFAAWNYMSTKRRQKHGADTKGVGGDNDPMS